MPFWKTQLKSLIHEGNSPVLREMSHKVTLLKHMVSKGLLVVMYGEPLMIPEKNY